MHTKFLLFSLAFAGIIVAQSGSRPNVVVILGDQLRADRLHVYGNPRPTSPNIDRLAAQGVVLQRFFANGPWTQPSQGTLATSLYPSRHGETTIYLRKEYAFPPGTTLAEEFQKGGYRTGAFVNNVVAGTYLLGRGFELFDERCGGCGVPESQAPQTVQRILGWIDSLGPQPFFMYIDFWEPHWPYAPPPEHDIFRNGSYPQERVAGYGPSVQNLFRWGKAGDLRAIERNLQLYDGYVHFLDEQIGRLIDEMKKRGLGENTIFLLTSDHGEMLFTHRKDFPITDHYTLYDAALRVPAIYWGAGIPVGKVVRAIASHVDTAPTLLELAGLEPKAVAQGKSLARVIRGEDQPVNEYVFAESDLSYFQRSVRNDRYKLILDLETGVKQLFDTQYDPHEQEDVAESYPEIVQRLSDVLDAWRRENEPAPEVLYERWRNVAEKNRPEEIIEHVGATALILGDGWRILAKGDGAPSSSYWTQPMGNEQPLRKAIWRPVVAKIGKYRISIRYSSPKDQTVASNVPVTIATRSARYSRTLDQTKTGINWVELGVFEDPVSVTLTNEANGWVIADAVKFERLN